MTTSRHPTRPSDHGSAPVEVPDLPEDLVPDAIRSYAATIRGAAIGLAGGPLIPVLGPVLGVILAMSCWARLLALRDMRRGGFAFRPEMEWALEQAWRLAWASAVGGSLVAVTVARDAGTTGAHILSSGAAVGALVLWGMVVLAEVLVGSVAFGALARDVEVWWVDRLQRVSRLVLVGSLALWIGLGALGTGALLSAGGAALLLLAQFLTGLLPAIAALFVMADGISRLSAVVIQERLDAREERNEEMAAAAAGAAPRPSAEDDDRDQPIPLD